MNHFIKLFEIDVQRCTLIYGVEPCSAALGVTGNHKCFNAPGSCQVPEDFTSEEVTLRWVTNSEVFPQLDAIPSLLDVRTMPQVIKPGESLGKRERATVSLKDHPHDDYGFDPYVEERDYNPFRQSTFCRKFFARYPNMQGYPARTYSGIYDASLSIDDLLATLDTAHYVIDKVELAPGGMQFSLVDVLNLTDPKKTLIPRPNNGVLDAEMPAITGPGDTFTLLPEGIGATYSASGFGSIDKEYFSFTRVDDVFTITGRGLRDSEQKSHEEGATFQESAVFSGNVAQILEQILDRTETPATYYDTAVWLDEAGANAPEILEAHIAQPTPAETLLNHLMSERMLSIFTDIYAAKIRMFALRPLPATKSFSDDNLKGIVPELDNDSRVDTVYFRFGRLNPVEKINEPKNYAGNLLRLADNPYEALQNNTSAIREIHSIFIPSTLRTLADDMAKLIIARYNRLLRRLRGKTTLEYAPELGEIVNVTTDYFVDDTGATLENVPMQVVSVNQDEHEVQLTLVEYSFGNYNFTGSRVVSILVNMLNVNLRELYEATYGTDPIPEDINIVFEGNPDGDVLIGSDGSDWAVNVGEWPEVAELGVSIDLRYLRIVGAGGQGGGSVFSHPEGYGGGGALYTRVPITAAECLIGGGGGGGGSTVLYGGSGGSYGPIGTEFGGRGAGHLTGGGATVLAGGSASGPLGGDGGDLGMPGEDGDDSFSADGYPGGPAGIAIDGVSYVTLIDCDVRGPEIN